VLKGNKLTEGNVIVAGEKAVIRQRSFERSVPKTDVLFVADTKDDVYRFVLAQVSPTDVVGRLGVARWCMFSGLREQALTEAKEVLKLQPTNTAAAAMVRSLEASLKQFPTSGITQVVAAKPAAGTGALVAVEPEPDVTAEGATTFSARAQPVLANQCMECHARADYPGAFKLIRITGFEVGPQSTKSNLRATAAQLKKEDPLNSPLLTKALATHGGMKQPAFVSRQAAGYRLLEAWVALATPPAALPVPPMATPVQPVLPPAAVEAVAQPPVPPMSVPVPPAALKPVLPAADPAPVIPPAETFPPVPVLPPGAVVPPTAPPARGEPTIPLIPPATTPALPPVDPLPAIEPAPAVPAVPPWETEPAPSEAAPAVPVPAVPVPVIPTPTIPVPAPAVPVPAIPVPEAPLPSEVGTPALPPEMTPAVPPTLPAPPVMVPAAPAVPLVLPTPASIPVIEPNPKSPVLPMSPMLPLPPGQPDVSLPKPPAGAKPVPVPVGPSQFGTATPPKPAKTGPAGGDEFDPANFNPPK